MLHIKLIGRIALALSIVILSGVNLAANAAQQAANPALINPLETRSSNPAIPGNGVATNSSILHCVFCVFGAVLPRDVKPVMVI